VAVNCSICAGLMPIALNGSSACYSLRNSKAVKKKMIVPVIDVNYIDCWRHISKDGMPDPFDTACIFPGYDRETFWEGY
jgi:hypothetical protein